MRHSELTDQDGIHEPKGCGSAPVNNVYISLGNGSGQWVDNRPDWNQPDSNAPNFLKNKPSIPEKTSDLNNDSDFITNTEVNDLISDVNQSIGNLLGQNNGIATLDGTGKVPSHQLPSYVDDVLEVASFLNLPATGENGKIYVVLDTSKTYRWTGSTYIEISTSDVNSVNGKVGAVTLNKSDIGLSNVDNTSDLNKPVSNATQTELNNLQSQIDTLSSNPGGGSSEEDLNTGYRVFTDWDKPANSSYIEAWYRSHSSSVLPEPQTGLEGKTYCCLYLRTNTSQYSNATVNCDSHFIKPDMTFTHKNRIKFNFNSTVSAEYFSGISDTTTANIINGYQGRIGFRFVVTNGSMTVRGEVGTSNINYSQTSPVSVNVNTFVRTEIKYTSSAVEFYVNGSLIGTLTNNIPTDKDYMSLLEKVVKLDTNNSARLEAWSDYVDYKTSFLSR